MKKLLIVLICLLIIITSAGIWGYHYFFGMNDHLRMQLEEEFDEGFFTFHDIDIKDHSSNESNIATEDRLLPADSTNITVEYISSKYASKLQTLETVMMDRVNILMQSAYEEYTNLQPQNQLGQAQLVRKYLQAGNMLEASIQSALNDLLREMEMELVAHQLPTDLVNETEKYYQQMIQEIKSYMLNVVN